MHLESYFAELQRKYPDVHMRLVDHAELPFSEQVRLSHETDILVGVHGAGLTHGMFLPHRSTVVEIQPPELQHKGFRLMAESLGHDYLVCHGQNVSGSTGDWQHDDVYMPKDEFMGLVEEAIASARKFRL